MKSVSVTKCSYGLRHISPVILGIVVYGQGPQPPKFYMKINGDECNLEATISSIYRVRLTKYKPLDAIKLVLVMRKYL